MILEWKKSIAKQTYSFGTILAIVISWTANKSLGFALLHGLLGWAYVFYYAVRYHYKLF